MHSILACKNHIKINETFTNDKVPLQSLIYANYTLINTNHYLLASNNVQLQTGAHGIKNMLIIDSLVVYEPIKQ